MIETTNRLGRLTGRATHIRTHARAGVGACLGRAALAIVLVATFPAISEKPPRYQFDEAFDFSRLQTFDLRLHESRQREGAMATSVLPKFAALVEELLTAKGYVRNAEQPDFLVTFDTVVVDDYEWTSWSGHAEVAQGLLALRMTEPAQQEPFWMGADVAGITGKITPEKAWKKVEPATRRILAGFPPPR